MIPERIETAEWLQRPETQAIFAALDGAPGHTMAVGGVVRDTLVGRLRDNPDIDMATQLLPVTVMQRAKAAGIAAHPTGIEHGTVTLVLNGTVAEVTTLREDVRTDGRHAEVRFGTDWVRDAQRRDFTLNALYCHADGRLFDPLAGAGDLINQRVRFIGDPARRITEDGLRVWRFFRFSASHGGQTFDADGLGACRAAVGRLDHISAERIGAEMRRMLGLPQIAQTLAVMAEVGLLGASGEALRALMRYEAMGGHALATRLALLNDDVAALRDRWRLPNALVDTARRIDEAAALLDDGKTGWAAYRFGEDAVEGLALAAARADWPRERLMETARELSHLPVAPLPVTGRDLLAQGMMPGPQLGERLAALERHWVESGFTLDRDTLLAMAGEA